MDPQPRAIEARFPNWLPLPGEGLIPPAQQEPEVDESDLFSKGEIASFYPNQGYGYVRTAHGAEILFRLSEVTLVGPKGEPSCIAIGRRVGYDASHTSHGMHVSRLKVY